MLKGNRIHDDISDDDFVSEKQIFQGSNKTILTLESIHVVKGIDKHVKKRIEEGKVYLSDISPVKNAEIEEAFLKSLCDNASKNNIISKKKYYSGKFTKDLNIKIEENYKCFSIDNNKSYIDSGGGHSARGSHSDPGDTGDFGGTHNLHRDAYHFKTFSDNEKIRSNEVDMRRKKVQQESEPIVLEKKKDNEDKEKGERDKDMRNEMGDEKDEEEEESEMPFYDRINSFVHNNLKQNLFEKFSFNDFPEVLERETIDYIKKKERKLQKKRLNANLEALRLQYIPINNDKFVNIPTVIKENILALFACIIIKHIDSFDDIQVQNHLDELSKNFLKQMSDLLVIDPLAYKCIIKPLEQRELIRDITGDKKIYQLYEKPFVDNLLIQIQDLQPSIDLKFQKVVEELNNEMDFWQNDNIIDEHNNETFSDIEKDISYSGPRRYSNSSNLFDDEEEEEEENEDIRNDAKNLSSIRGSFIQREIDESYNGEAINDYFSCGENNPTWSSNKNRTIHQYTSNVTCSTAQAGSISINDGPKAGKNHQNYLGKHNNKKINKINPQYNEKRSSSECHNNSPIMHEQSHNKLFNSDNCNFPENLDLPNPDDRPIHPYDNETKDDENMSYDHPLGKLPNEANKAAHEICHTTTKNHPREEISIDNDLLVHGQEETHESSSSSDNTKEYKSVKNSIEPNKKNETGSEIPCEQLKETEWKQISRSSSNFEKNVTSKKNESDRKDEKNVGVNIQARIKTSINRSDTFEGESDYDEIDIDKHLNHGVPTRGPEVKSVLLRDLITTYIMTGNNNARIQLYFQKFARCLKINELLILRIEENLAADLISALQASTNETSKRKKIRRIKIAAAALGGGALIAFTAGLAAPGIIAGLTALGAGGSSLTAFLASASGLAFIVSLFGAGGAGLTGYKYSRRIANIRTFEFIMLNGTISKSLSVCVCVSGEIKTDDDITNPWIDVFPNCYCDLYALKWENHLLKTLGSLIETMLSQEFAITASRIWLQYTIASTLSAALTWPLALIKYASSLDNVYLLIRERAQQAGRILADALSDRNTVGQRPVILVGYSVGARVIFYCLKYLHAKKLYNIVSNAIFIGLPATTSTRVWEKIRMVVTNRVINVYSKNDWLLGFLYRYMEWKLSVAGLIAVNVPNVENYDASGIILSHLDYKRKLKDIFNLINFDM
ncbi:hypothetical protein, conserved [Plasmodium gonderi]|uniref:Uncharacterized protein n=1 Tax=Plasmodium gonderi TaxID=77519 RepID=A0A1Y1JPN0_PLAGO|nr:hypothetical protein, conserved [Plasmodium gonderi]GAW82792.1 hypothetical protein, conserved [Plasmodium gonderi]